jgi:hypothetical protein
MQLEVKEGIKIEIHNKDTGRGHYYPEDDWSIEAVGPTYEEAIELIIPEYINSGIYPSGKYVSDVKYITYNNKQYVIYDSDKTPPTLIYNNVLTDIEEHPFFKKLAEEKRRKMEIRKREGLKRKKAENEINEKKLLKKLKKKYDK